MHCRISMDFSFLLQFSGGRGFWLMWQAWIREYFVVAWCPVESQWMQCCQQRILPYLDSCLVRVRFMFDMCPSERLRTQEDGKVFLPFLEPWKQPPPRDPDVHVEFSHTDQEALPGPWQRTLIEDIDLVIFPFISIHFLPWSS